MRKFVLLGVVGVVLAGVALVVRYTVFLDLAGYELNLVSHVDPEAYRAAGAALHLGDGDCLRYSDVFSSSEQEAEAIARELFAAGVDRFAFNDLTPRFFEWSEELERSAHREEKIDEHIALVSRDSTGASLILRLNRSRLKENADRALASQRLRASEAWARLSPEQQSRVRAVFDRNPRAFSVSALLRVVHAYSGVTTEAKLARLGAHVEAMVRSGQPAPKMLHGLAGLPPDAHEDGWNSHFELRETQTGYRIWSNGADLAEGGEGPNRDYVHEIVLRELPPPPPPRPCSPLPESVALQRSEIEAALGDLSALAYSARLVPHFVDGQAIGFRISEIRDGSLYGRIGLCDEDVVLSIGDVQLLGAGQAMTAFNVLREASEVPVRVRRADADAVVVMQITP